MNISVVLFWFNNGGFYLNFIQFYFDSWIAEIISTAFQCCPSLAFRLTHMSSGGHPPYGLLWSCVCLHGVSASWYCFVFHWLFLHLPSSVVTVILRCPRYERVLSLASGIFHVSASSASIKGRRSVLVNEKQVHFPKQTFSFPTCELSPSPFRLPWLKGNVWGSWSLTQPGQTVCTLPSLCLKQSRFLRELSVFSEILTHLSIGVSKALHQLRRELPSRFGGTVILPAYCHLSSLFHVGEILKHTKKTYSYCLQWTHHILDGEPDTWCSGRHCLWLELTK